MDGEGGDAIERTRPEDAAFDLPSVLARLDTQEPTEQRAAVETIRDALSDHPEVCTPTVPKLRALLEQPELAFHDEVAYCLAELAAASPTDVAPSIDEIASFAAANPAGPATGELLRCLTILAAEQPSTVAEYTTTVADVIDRRPGYDRWGLRMFQRLSTERPAAVEPAGSILVDALATAPEEHGAPALSTLGRLARSEATVPSLSFVEHARALADHDDASLRRNALGCLADVALDSPSAVEPAHAELTAALERDDPDTRANAAVAIARLAANGSVTADADWEPVLELLADDHDRVRANACVALGHGRVAAAADRLATLAREDPAPDVRERAEWALRRVS